MKIKAKIDRMVNSGNVKAIASVSLDGMFVVKNLKIMDGNWTLVRFRSRSWRRCLTGTGRCFSRWRTT